MRCDHLFYGTMLFGSLVSLLAALWKFMCRGPAERPLLQLYPLMSAIGEARDPSELAAIEQKIDAIKRELERYAAGSIEAEEMGALALATHRLGVFDDAAAPNLKRRDAQRARQRPRHCVLRAD